MPNYRENSLSMPFTMLCPGISLNPKHHQLTLYKGQVWREKSYVELCNHNILNIVYTLTVSLDSPTSVPIEQNGELYEPPVLSHGFINQLTRIPWDNEILQSFSKLTNITTMTFHSLGSDVTYQIEVGPWSCNTIYHHKQCAPPISYNPRYIWTKVSFKVQICLIRFEILTFRNHLIWTLLTVSTTRNQDSKSVRIIW